jgi:hypothetical protein
VIEFSRAAVIATLAMGAVLIGVFIYLVLSSTHFEKNGQGVNATSIADCVGKFGASTGAKQMQELNGVNSFCYNYVAYQLSADEGIIRRDNYVFQRNENVVLMYMVVLITFMGVLLAGLQLLASYKLASVGKGELGGGGEIQYSAGGASFKSSVIGLVILALSFAFFLVFVVYVYNFSPERRAADASRPLTSIQNAGRLASPAPQPKEAAPTPPSTAPGQTTPP